VEQGEIPLYINTIFAGMRLGAQCILAKFFAESDLESEDEIKVWLQLEPEWEPSYKGLSPGLQVKARALFLQYKKSQVDLAKKPEALEKDSSCSSSEESGSASEDVPTSSDEAVQQCIRRRANNIVPTP
jgi:hypothetical protein